MADSAWTTLLDDVLPKVNGCDEAFAVHEIRAAARDFFTRTRAWRIDLTLNVVANQGTYSIVPPAGRISVMIERAYHGEKFLPHKSPDELAILYEQWETKVGEPRMRTQDTPNTLTLVPIPEAALTNGLKVRLSVAPTETSTGMEDEMLTAYRPTIALGAVARLLAVPDKPWTDLPIAAAYQNVYEQGVASAQHDAAKGFGRGRIRNRTPNSRFR